MGDTESRGGRRRKEAEVAEKATDGVEGASEEEASEQKGEQEEKNETEDQMELESEGLDPPVVELSEEERNMWFRNPAAEWYALEYATEPFRAY